MASSLDSAHDLLDLPISTLRQYVEFFPQDGLSKVITGYLSSPISKYPLVDPIHQTDGANDRPESPDLSEGGVALTPVIDAPQTPQDCLLLMTVSAQQDMRNIYMYLTTDQEGIEEAKTSPLAHCLLGDYWLSLEEWESAVEVARRGLKLAAAESKKSDLGLQRFVIHTHSIP